MVIGLKKKGDVTITTVILIVLGLAVLVMMIIGFTKGWDVIFGPRCNAPSELQTYSKGFGLYAQGGLSIDFCNYKLIEFNGRDEIVNCRDDRVIASINASNVNLQSPSLACSRELEAANQKAACNSLLPNAEKAWVNGAEIPCKI